MPGSYINPDRNGIKFDIDWVSIRRESVGLMRYRLMYDNQRDSTTNAFQTSQNQSEHSVTSQMIDTGHHIITH